MNRNHLLLLFILLYLGGCGGALKSGWNNFTAYYNTYYNAKEYFRDGIQAVEEKPLSINPDEPVRVHSSPPGAGSESFKQAIQKSVQVLQQHRQSVWADDALILMGQSLYYLQEFAAALQRFEEIEVMSTDTSLIAESAIWKGRTMLDMQDYQGGVEYIESVLDDYPSAWSLETKGKLQILAAEHYAMMEEWERSSNLLSAALTNITDRQLLGKTYFLYGQMLEWGGRLGEANYAYSQVASQFPGFEYTYWAERKRAATYRGQGNIEAALSVYRQLLNDDKYLDRRYELMFEIGRTLEDQGEVREAEKQYRQLLYGNNHLGERELQARIYYRLGMLYSDYFNDHSLAAAYYDSSASQGWISEEEGRSPDLLIQYANLKESIAHTDSLLQLGELPPARLDSLLEEVRAQKRQELQEKQYQPENEERMRNEPVVADEGEQSNRSSIYGFLNHRSAQMVEEGQREFQLVWGDRPLVDNWRRQEALRGMGTREEGIEGEEERQGISQNEGLDIDFNPGAIPRTEEQKKQLEEQQTKRYYQLANLLFLDLNKPDSAKAYYRKVISREESSLRPKAMYALTEVYAEEGLHSDSISYWKDRIKLEYSGTEYADLVLADAQSVDNTSEIQNEHLARTFQQLRSSREQFKGAEMRMLVEDHASVEIAPHIHYQAVEEYIAQAKVLDTLTNRYIRQALQSPKDFSIQAPAYQSIYWDSVRIVLEEHKKIFDSGSPYQSKVNILSEEIGPSQIQQKKLSTCSEKGISLEVDPDMGTFLESVDFPDQTEEEALFGKVTYVFVVNKEGNIEEYELASMSAVPDIENALEQAFEDRLRFKSPSLDEGTSRIRCRVDFPLQR